MVCMNDLCIVFQIENLGCYSALKDISEALEQKLSSSKDISEAQRVF